MKLTVTHRDAHGELSAAFELPPTVSLSSDALKEYGDSLAEIVIGQFEPPEDPDMGASKGFHPINN